MIPVAPREVLLTGVGLCTPLGDSLAEFSSRILHGLPPFLRERRASGQDLAVARLSEDLDQGLDRGQAGLLDRSAKMALLAGSRALADAGLSSSAPSWAEGAVHVGNGSGPTQSVHDAYLGLLSNGRLPGLTLLRCLPSGAASLLAMRQGLCGGAQTYTCACASSGVAIGEAMRAIRHGYLDWALVGGTEAPLGEGTLRAWEAMRVLAPCGDDPGSASRPFDRHRRGLVLGEGAAFVVLESETHARARQARAHARLAGYGASNDAHHWTEPRIEGQIQAMRAALTDAGITPADVCAVNAHGTGTVVGDRVEAAALESVFAAAAGPAVPVSSTKSVHGHLLGASGAVELVAALITLRTGLVPPTRNLHEPDVPNSLDWVQGAAREIRAAGLAVLSNSFAFGGSNACLVLSRPTCP